MDCDRDWFIIEFAASLSMDIVKVVCVKIPCIVLIMGLVGAALCISERLFLVFPAITMECRYYNNMMLQSVYVHYFWLFLLESSRSFFRNVLFFLIYSSFVFRTFACSWSRSWRFSVWHVCFGFAEVDHRIVLIGLLFWFDSRGFFQLAACRIWSLCSCWKFQYCCFVYVY